MKNNSIDLDGRWAYKWLRDLINQVVDGLKDRPRSGSRPPEVSEETFAEIRRELSEKPFRMEG